MRKRSKDYECSRCTMCLDSPHCWLEEAVDSCDDLSEAPCEHSATALRVAADNDGCLWVCRHCPAWMEYVGDDDDDTDLDAAWETGQIVLE